MKILKMSRAGDEVIGSWTPESPVAEVGRAENAFLAMQLRGYNAFGIDSGRRIDAFEPGIDEDVLFVAPMVGG